MSLKSKITFTSAAGDFHELYERSLFGHKTNDTRCQRHYILDRLARQDRGLHVAECGVFRGSSAYMIASRLKQTNLVGTTLHLFDSFQGLSERTAEDGGIKVMRRFRYPLNRVKRNLKEFDFIKYYPGWIPERFDEVKELTFSLVHIDVDLYQPTYDSLAFFYPRLKRHGVIVFDDYGTARFPGARKAIDEYRAKLTGDDIFFMDTPAGEAFLIKWS